MIAVDTGFLYALADARDRWHAAAFSQAATAAEGWITTWPVLTECCHFLGSRLGPRYVQALLDDVADGALLVWDIPAAAASEIGKPMRKYAALPMDLADASLVLLAERLGHGRILSTDTRDFGAYRWRNRKPFRNCWRCHERDRHPARRPPISRRRLWPWRERLRSGRFGPAGTRATGATQPRGHFGKPHTGALARPGPL